jgi:enterochelin esterase-like enzyme
VQRLSRRAVLIGGAGLLLGGGTLGYEFVQDGALPGKYELARLDGGCGSAPPAPRGPRPVRRTVRFYSAYRRRLVQMVTLMPAGAGRTGLGVVLALHGSGSDAAAMADLMAPAMTAASVRRFAVVCVDGGDAYWHRRADGDDPVGMIVHEVLPRAFGAVSTAGRSDLRFGLIGVSMGGYGALLLAERSAAAQPPVLTAAGAVAALSPAFFASYADAIAANPTSFDSPADFAANNVLARTAALRRVPAWVACGEDDPFQSQASDLRARLAALTRRQVPGGIMPGCHDDAFCARNTPAALRFIADHLG